MAFSFHLPDIGEGVVEGEIVSWKVAEGDQVELDQPIVEVMTDKATVEIPSPRKGRVKKIHFGEGEICPVGEVLIEIDDGSASAADGHGGELVTAAAAVSGCNGSAAAETLVAAAAPAGAAIDGRPEVIDATSTGARVLATPATRRVARKLGVDLRLVPPTGKRGRVTTQDVKRFAEAGSQVPAPASARYDAPAPIAVPSIGQEERIPLRGMRKRIADNMTRSVHSAAHFTYVEEVDVSELVALRDRSKAKAAERGVKLTYLPFIIKAITSGLKKWPQLNAALDESTQEIVRKGYYHIGIATQGPQGLAVTVVRDADRRSIFELAAEIDRLGRAVNEGTASRDELTGSTFTITSLGKLGGLLATPIINYPEVGILGVHKIEQRPVVKDGAIVPAWRMNLSISLDHRLVDGWDGAMFLQDVKTLLEDPTLMFMEMV
jgi:pyruvate dehydrogenase E2 component (dihydrolipoamide acetyltransferase)